MRPVGRAPWALEFSELKVSDFYMGSVSPITCISADMARVVNEHSPSGQGPVGLRVQ